MPRVKCESSTPHHLLAADSRVSQFREQTLVRVGNEIRRRSWTQKQAAKYLSVSQPRISDALRGKFEKFTLDTALRMLLALDLPVSLSLDSEATSGREFKPANPEQCAADISFANALIEENPKDDQAWCRRAWAYWQLGDYEAAKRDYLKALDANPKSERARRNLAVMYEKFGQPEKALAELEKLTQMYPERSYASNLAPVYATLGRNEEALQCFSEAVKLKPNRPGPYFNRAGFLRQLGRKIEALHDYQAICRIDPLNNRAQAAIEELVAGK